MKTGNVCTVIMIAIFSGIAAHGQERDHDLVKDGDPVSGMSAQQEKRPAVAPAITPRSDESERRVPLLTESTLNDEALDSWRAGDAFRDEMPEPPADSIKVIALPRSLNNKTP